MMRLAMVLTVLGLAAPALADEAATQAAVLTDAQLDQVAGGCDSTGAPTGVSTVPTTNVNISPIVVNQTAVAITQQDAKQSVAGKGKGKALGVLKQSASTVAMNYLNINYHPKF